MSICLQYAICQGYKRCQMQEAVIVRDAQENHIIDHHVERYKNGCQERHGQQRVSAVIAFLIHLPLLARVQHFKHDEEEADNLDGQTEEVHIQPLLEFVHHGIAILCLRPISLLRPFDLLTNGLQACLRRHHFGLS